MSLHETPAQPWLRALAAVLALTAGAVHLGQVGVHLAEGWPIAGFFLVVGVIQVAAAGLLFRPRPRSWFWVGIAASAAVIGVWIVSRALGLPFVEGGEPEPVGVADGVASLTEAWTIVVLGAYLAEPTRPRRLTVIGLATLSVLGLTGLWWLAADAGIFNADPARLALDQPWVVDWLVASGGIGLAAAMPLALRRTAWRPWRRGLLRGLVGMTAVSVAGLAWLTLPPTIGQNLDCQAAPLSTALGGGHADAAEPIALDTGELVYLPAFEVRACGSSAVTLERAEPVTTDGGGATIGGVWLLPVGVRLTDEGSPALPAGAVAVPPGAQIVPGQPRQLIVGLEATGDGDFSLASLRLTYRTTEAGSFAFATQIVVCSGPCGDG
ncbi:MAG: hypothetical protein WEB29_07215 [Chloroflexota bacterium]